ncbi:hypothetical protein [Blastococcus sp. SYSU D00813]
MTAPAVPWPVLLAATGPVLAWGPVLAAGGAALALAGLPALVPGDGGGLLLALGVVVLASGCAAAGEEPSPGVPPVGPGRRLLARALLVLPVSAAVLGGVLGLAAAAGVATGRGPVLLWALLSAVAAGVGAAVRRSGADVPGPAVAVVVLGAGLVLLRALPDPVVELAPWDTTAERVGWALGIAALLLVAATHDPAARRVRGGRGRRPARPRAPACR